MELDFLLPLLIGVVCGAVATYFVMWGLSAKKNATLLAERQTQEDSKERIKALLEQTKSDNDQRHREEIERQKATHIEEIENIRRMNNEAAESREKKHKEEIDRLREDQNSLLEKLREDNERVVAETSAKHQSEITRLTEGYEQTIKSAKEDAEKRLQETKSEGEKRLADDLARLRQSYEDQLNLFKKETLVATEKLLKERSQELHSANSLQMDTLLKPLREDIAKMEKSMDENRDSHIKNTSSLQTYISQIMEKTNSIGQQADRLSNALERKNKVMGNWGELILTDLLEAHGLRKGYEYDSQQTMKDANGNAIRNDETGKRMIPDVILHLADNRDVIIDSKVSLTAFVDYVNAEDDAQKEEALNRHIDSIRNHIKEFSAKDYSSYITKPRESSDFVIMFVPNEGAIQLFMQAVPELWNEAFNKYHVFIAGSQTLIAALHIISLTWMRVKQERNTEKIMDEARKLIDRVSSFYKEFVNVGKQLDDACKAYKKVTDRVSEGSRSIMSSGRRLEELGVKGKNSIKELGIESEIESEE